MMIPLKRFGILSIAGVLFITACNNSTSDSATTTGDSSSNTASAGTVDSSSTKKEDSAMANKIGNTNPEQATIDYLVPGNTKEIAWLMAGISKGTSKELKDHAKKMLADHKKLGDKVKALIASKNLTAPPVDTIGVVDINDKKGAEWDKAWVDKMVTDHSELLTKLSESETSVKDPELKTLVTNTKPVVQSHLDMTKMMQGKMK